MERNCQKCTQHAEVFRVNGTAWRSRKQKSPKWDGKDFDRMTGLLRTGCGTRRFLF